MLCVLQNVTDNQLIFLKCTVTLNDHSVSDTDGYHLVPCIRLIWCGA